MTKKLLLFWDKVTLPLLLVSMIKENFLKNCNSNEFLLLAIINILGGTDVHLSNSIDLKNYLEF